MKVNRNNPHLYPTLSIITPAINGVNILGTYGMDNSKETPVSFVFNSLKYSYFN